MLKVALVVDHKLFRKSLALLINTFAEIKVCLEAENGKVLFEKLKDGPVDIVLLDIQMPEMNGYETCAALSKLHPNIKIMIVAQSTTNVSTLKMLDCGAHGIFTKSDNPNDLEAAIKQLFYDGYCFGIDLDVILKKAFTDKAIKNSKQKFNSVNFTHKEMAVLKMACKQYNSGEIANLLNINIRTVESHRKSIMEKTDSKNFTGAILFALRHYYLTFDEN